MKKFVIAIVIMAIGACAVLIGYSMISKECTVTITTYGSNMMTGESYEHTKTIHYDFYGNIVEVQEDWA